MTPIDDELRALLRARADGVAPAPDPLGGIERRARGLRRRRAAAAIAGAALAVTGIAVAVPAVTGGSAATGPDPYGTSSPTTSPVDYPLDPTHPWPARGQALTQGTLDTFQRDWQALHPGHTMSVLFSQVYEPSGNEEAVFVDDGGLTGYVTSSESGSEFLAVRELSLDFANVLVFALPGDEVPRLLAVAAPGVSDFAYQPDEPLGTPRQMTMIADGVAVTALDGQTANDMLVVTGPDGMALSSGEAPDLDGSTVQSDPLNLLTWLSRGDYGLMKDEDVRLAYANAVGTEPELESYHYRPLYTGDTDSGVRYTIGQAWASGDAKAHTFGYATGGTNGPQVFLGPLTPDKADLVALVVDSLPGTTTDLLVLVPRPGTGQLSYDDNGTGSFRPVAEGRSDLNGIGFVDRSTRATNDRVEQLDGDGDLDHPIYRGPVAPFLCGDKECG